MKQKNENQPFNAQAYPSTLLGMIRGRVSPRMGSGLELAEGSGAFPPAFKNKGSRHRRDQLTSGIHQGQLNSEGRPSRFGFHLEPAFHKFN